uniref:Aminotransferase-like plant mobile domain-containing protein n=1 Tax=Leersia perrieri TaxID=77586 RepID=A0A0D9WSH3_9ORYZ
MKQFGMFQPHPPLLGWPLADSLHSCDRYTRKGFEVSYDTMIKQKLASTVADWADATDNVFPDTAPDDANGYAMYLQWYRSVARWRCFPPQDDTDSRQEPTIETTTVVAPRVAFNEMC